MTATRPATIHSTCWSGGRAEIPEKLGVLHDDGRGAEASVRRRFIRRSFDSDGAAGAAARGLAVRQSCGDSGAAEALTRASSMCLRTSGRKPWRSDDHTDLLVSGLCPTADRSDSVTDSKGRSSRRSPPSSCISLSVLNQSMASISHGLPPPHREVRFQPPLHSTTQVAPNSLVSLVGVARNYRALGNLVAAELTKVEV
ncbi:hypothetical protein MPTK2_2g19890 [Marchantia polymorpha subsp. ruderalis]